MKRTRPSSASRTPGAGYWATTDADQGRSSVLDANKSTILEIDSAGECRGHDGLHVGSLVGFTYHQTKLVAFVFLLRPHLFRDKPKSFLRAMRKSASRASGAHGFFAKAA